VSGGCVNVIDYRFATAEQQIELLVRHGDEETIYEIDKDPDDDLGIEFVEPLFDRLRTCNNKCPFCFLTQMPKGLRKSLYLKDDDYRLGFLYGNFVTLTNLKDEDWQRIEDQHLSPMYVSIHCDPDRALRAICLANQDVPDVSTKFGAWARWGSRSIPDRRAAGAERWPAMPMRASAASSASTRWSTIAVVAGGADQISLYRQSAAEHSARPSMSMRAPSGSIPTGSVSHSGMRPTARRPARPRLTSATVPGWAPRFDVPSAATAPTRPRG